VTTSGSYTDSAPVDRFRIVACTNAPRLAALASVQPDAAGDWPSGPVSCHGVLSPRAVSGFAGTMMSQFMLAAGGGAGALALGEGDGQGVAGAVADADGDTDGLGPGEAVGDALGLGPAGAVADAAGAGVESAVAEGEVRLLLVAAGTPPPAPEADPVTAGPVVADAVAVGPTQGSAGLLDELSRVLACGTSTKTRPAATTMASTAISAGYARLRSSLWPR
jgi:hypothetical protein